MRDLAIACIRLYQRHLSPLKGYTCAYRHHTGRCGCSGLGLRAIRRYGALHGLSILQRRLYLCGVAYRRHAPVHKRPHRSQRGDCVPLDCGLDAGDCGKALDVADCLATIGDCGWSTKKQADEQYVHIPPNSMRK